MLYEFTTNEVESWEIAPPFVDLLQDTSIKFVHADVESIDSKNGVIEGRGRVGSTEQESMHLSFDRAVVSVGSETANVDKVPGAQNHAMPFYTFDDAVKLRERLRELLDDTRANEVVNVVVVGGGFSGVEISSCLAENLGSRGSVVVVERGDRLLSAATDHNRTTSERVLQERGVTVEYRKNVVEVKEDSITLQSNRDPNSEISETIKADLVLWTAGSKPRSVLNAFGLPLDDRGKVLADRFLQVEGKSDRLFVVGDVVAPQNRAAYTGTAQVAVQQAEYVAWNVWASLTGQPKLEYRYAHLGEMMVLGSRDATVTSPVGVELDGKAAWALRRTAYLARMPTNRHRMRVAASWAADPLLRGVARAAAETRRRSGLADNL